MAELTVAQERQVAAYIEGMYAQWLPQVEAAVLGGYNRFGAMPDPAAVNATAATWNQQVQQLINQQLIPLAQASYGEQDPEGQFTLGDALVAAAATATVFFLAAQVGEIRSQLVTVIAAAVTAQQAAALVADFLRPAVWAAKAAQLAATEGDRWVQVATLAGALAAQRRDGVERVKEWTTRRDDRVREAHADAAGQRRGLREFFSVGGFPMLYPKDPAAPPYLVVNCRCGLRILKQGAGRG